MLAENKTSNRFNSFLWKRRISRGIAPFSSRIVLVVYFCVPRSIEIGETYPRARSCHTHKYYYTHRLERHELGWARKKSVEFDWNSFVFDDFAIFVRCDFDDTNLSMTKQQPVSSIRKTQPSRTCSTLSIDFFFTICVWSMCLLCCVVFARRRPSYFFNK